MKARFAASLVSLLFAASAASAATVSVAELEPNDSIAAAQVLAPLLATQTGYRVSGVRTDVPGFAPSVDSSADYFTFAAQAGTLITLDASATASAPGSSRDVLLYLYDALGNVLAFDDNSGVDFGSRIAAFPILASGAYVVGVSGFGDTGDLDNGGNGILTGIGGDANFSYLLSIDVADRVIPLPGSAALLLGGALLLTGFGRMRPAPGPR